MASGSGARHSWEEPGDGDSHGRAARHGRHSWEDPTESDMAEGGSAADSGSDDEPCPDIADCSDYGSDGGSDSDRDIPEDDPEDDVIDFCTELLLLRNLNNTQFAQLMYKLGKAGLQKAVPLGLAPGRQFGKYARKVSKHAGRDRDRKKLYMLPMPMYDKHSLARTERKSLCFCPTMRSATCMTASSRPTWRARSSARSCRGRITIT